MRADPAPVSGMQERLRGVAGGEAWSPLLLPGALSFAVFLVFAAREAGYPTTVWYPAALFLVALAALALPSLGSAVAVSRMSGAAIAFLAAFTAWSFASIAWADVRADAWDGANRTLLYLVVYALFAALPWRAGTLALLLGGYALGVAVLGGVAFWRAAGAANPDVYFLLGRFAEPAGYQNANCALFLIAFFPAAFLASRREVPALARAALLAGAGVLLELALMAQSRASVVAFPAAVLAYVLAVPGRLRSLLFLLPPFVAVAAAAPRLLDVFTALQDDEAVAATLETARGAIGVTAVSLFAAGLALSVLDRRVAVPERAVRGMSRALALAAGVAALAAVVAAVAAAGDVSRRVERAWDDFTRPEPAPSAESYFAVGLGSNRYDIWRVALLEFREAPVHGAGADNFAVAYLRERRTSEEPLYPHSLELQVLSQTGLVGAALLAGFVAAALLAAWPLRRTPPFARGVGATAVVVFVYWLAHGSVDWFWEFPGLTAPALAALGAAAALARRVTPTAAPGRRGAGVAAAVLALVLSATLLPPWLSAKEVQAAARSWRVEPEVAFDRLERARALNPLSDKPDQVAGAIASRLGNRKRMERSFRRALERNPHNWYSYFELAVASALDGRRREALRLLARAQSLSPSEPAIENLAEQVRAGRPVSPRQIDLLFLRRLDPAYDPGRRD